MPLHPFPQPLTALRYSRAMQVPLFEPYRWGRTEDWTVARAFVMADRGVGMRGRSAAAPRLSRSNVKRCIKHLSTMEPTVASTTHPMTSVAISAMRRLRVKKSSTRNASVNESATDVHAVDLACAIVATVRNCFDTMKGAPGQGKG